MFQNMAAFTDLRIRFAEGSHARIEPGLCDYKRWRQSNASGEDAPEALSELQPAHSDVQNCDVA